MRRKSVTAYLIAIVSVLVVLAIRYALDPILREVSPLILFLIPVSVSAWVGGFGPGLVATVLGGAVGIALFTGNARAPVEHSMNFYWLARGVPFLIVGTIISALAARAERARLRALANEAETRSSENFLRRLMASSADCIKVLDLDGRLLSINERGVKLLEVNDGASLIGTRWADWWKEQRELAQKAIDEAKAGGRGYFTALAPTMAGTPRWWDSAVTPIPDAQGRPERLLVVSRDITDHQRNLQHLAESRRRSDTALIAAEMGTFEWDIVNDRVFGDENFARIYAIHLDESGAAPLHDYLSAIHPDDVERVRSAIEAAIESGTDYISEFRIRADGRERWVLARGRVDRDASGRAVSFPGVVVDVTEHKRVSEHALSQEQRYRTLFNSVDDGFCIIEMIWDAAGNPVDYLFLEVNPTFEKQTSLIAPAGRRMRELVPNHDESWFAIYGKVARTGEPIRFINEAKVLQRWFDLYACRVGGEGSNQVAVLFKDITDRHRAEQERERLLASEQDARQEAELANRMKDEFLATISHELRTPLSAITGWAGLLQRVKQNGEMLDEGLDVIARNAHAQARLIEDILDVSRITSGKLRLNVRQVDLRQPICAAMATVSNAARAKGIRIEFDPLDVPAEIAGDADRLQQVFWNLLANAIKFSDDGSRVVVTLEARDARIVATVSDNGCGIEPAFLPFVFDRFRQADMSTTRRKGGLGLGLAIVRHLVELHGGTVSASSDGPGKGSRFCVSFPVVAGPPSSPADALTPAPQTTTPREDLPQLDGVRVLVLDDDADARRVLQATLEQYGAEVTVLGGVSDALGAISGDVCFDAILSDIGMPGDDGYEFIRRLRELESRGLAKPAPIAAVTAFTRDADRAAIRAAGFDYFLAKPIKPADLLRTVAKMTGRG